MSTINSIIREQRNALGITQKELADKLSISDKTISRWENGNQIPDAILLPDLAEALNISINELYGIKPTTNQSAIENTTDMLTNKLSKVLNICYKIAIAAGLTLFLFGSMMLIHINAVHIGTGEPRTSGNIFTYLGLILCVTIQIAYMVICRKKTLNSTLHIKSEITYGGTCTNGILAVLLIVFPTLITIPISYFYELATYILVTGATFMFFLQKQKLKKSGVNIGKGIDIISASLLLICTIIFVGIWVYFTFIYKFEINANSERERHLLELLYKLGGQTDLEYKTVRYSFLILTIPMFSAPLMNFIHLIIKSEQLDKLIK